MRHVNEDEVPEDGLNPRLNHYTVQLRNASTTTFDEVVLFYQRQGQSGVVIAGITDFAPNAVEVLPLGFCHQLVAYTVGFFVSGRMVARIPEDGGDMTPARAASLDPNRPDACTDSWAIYGSSFLPLDQLAYTVVIRNETPDTWDEVAVTYVLEGQNAVIASTAAVAPNTQVEVPLGPCDQVVGYNFAIFVDGLAVDFDPGRMSSARCSRCRAA